MAGERPTPPEKSSTFYAQVTVVNKSEIFEPYGAALKVTLERAGYTGFNSIRRGKVSQLEIDAPNQEEAKKLTDKLAAEFLSNAVIEDVTSVQVSDTPAIYEGNVPKTEDEK